MERAEIVVVGGGHNGAICAAYLARAGHDVLLIEARDEVGGCASTVTDLGARFNICNCDHNMIRGMPIAEELELGAHGLRYIESEIGAVHRFYDGADPWVFIHETDAHLDALARSHPHAVSGYRAYLADALPVAGLIVEMARTPPAFTAMTRKVLARRAAGAGRLLDWSRRSMDDVMADYFDDWHLVSPAVVTGPSVWGIPAATPGTGSAAALYGLRHTIKTGRPAGGSGALTDAVRASFEAAGGRTRTSSRVERLLVRDGAVTGVRLTDGTAVDAAVVVAACDPQRVCVEWLEVVPPAAQRMVESWRTAPVHDGYESKIDAVLTSLPASSAASALHELRPGADVLGPTTVVAPSPEDTSEAHDLRAQGLVHPRPGLLVNIPTASDPAMMLDPGEHVLSLEVLFTPYDHPGGWPHSPEPKRWLGLLDDLFEPGTLHIDRWRAMTPDRYETEFSMHRGHTPAYAASPLVALLGSRRDTTRYRTPIAGLYLSGAATFPGAGVFGAPGRNAADAVRRDLEGSSPGAVRRRRRLTTA